MDANWNDENINTFCDLWIEQTLLGNCANGKMNQAGYRSIAKEYFKKTGLKHSIRQLQKKASSLKRFYGMLFIHGYAYMGFCQWFWLLHCS